MVFFRADSNSVIAGGHIMRCLTIAAALKKAGEKVRFLTADDGSSSVLESYDMEYTVLNSDWKDLTTETDKVITLLKAEDRPVLVIDTYSVSKEYVTLLKPYCKTVYLGSKPGYLGPLDLLINYSADIDRVKYSELYPETKLLLGLSYAPIREEFQTACVKHREHIKRILITTGNTDKINMTGNILKRLLPLTEGLGIEANVVIGRMFDSKDELHSRYDGEKNVILHENVQSMSELMKACDIAVSANGTTVYELSAAGIAAVTFALVPEQINSAEALSALGAVDYCGEAFQNDDECAERIARRLLYYTEDPEKMNELAQRAHQLIEGNGCRRITDAVISLRS